MYFSLWKKSVNDPVTNVYFTLDTKYSGIGSITNNSQPLS